MTRARTRRAFPSGSTRGRRYMDFFCPRNGGIRVGYASPAAVRHLSARQRHGLEGRVVLILTANAHYAIHGVHAGSRLAVAERRLHLRRRFNVGLNTWYLGNAGRARTVLKVRHGFVEEVGLANDLLTTARPAAARFLRGFQ